MHLFCERHLLIETQVYLSVTRRGAVAITFFVSALLHELIGGRLPILRHDIDA